MKILLIIAFCFALISCSTSPPATGGLPLIGSSQKNNFYKATSVQFTTPNESDSLDIGSRLNASLLLGKNIGHFTLGVGLSNINPYLFSSFTIPHYYSFTPFIFNNRNSDMPLWGIKNSFYIHNGLGLDLSYYNQSEYKPIEGCGNLALACGGQWLGEYRFASMAFMYGAQKDDSFINLSLGLQKNLDRPEYRVFFNVALANEF